MKRYQDNKVFRLKNWNYSSPGSYFVTFTTAGRAKYLGEVKGDLVHLSKIGEIAYMFWRQIPQHFPFVSLGEFVIMPDHVHGILVFDYEHVKSDPNTSGDTKFCVPTRLNGKDKFGPQSKNLGSVIRGYKAAVRKYAVMNNLPFTWQSRFRDQLLRDLRHFENVSRYIARHPKPVFLNQK